MKETIPPGSSVEQIEALLRTALEGNRTQVGQSSSHEPLGPGDVQYLQSREEPTSIEINELIRRSLANDLALNQDRPAPSVVDQQRGSTPAEAVSTRPISPERRPDRTSGLSMSDLEDVELDITLELGRARLTFEELLALRDGSVVELDKHANDPIDILANGKLIARGEIVTINNELGIRICEVIRGR